MNRNFKLAAFVALAILGGTGGGFVSSYLIQPPTAQAFFQGLQGDDFWIRDQKGEARFGFGLSGRNQEFTWFRMADRNGRDQIVFTVTHDRAPKIEIRDHRGRLIRTRLARVR